MNRLSVIIPSRNAENLAACVRAVRQYEPGLRIIVVDDRINWDQYISLIPDMIQSITGNVVEGVRPFIFARNVNLGIAAAGIDDVILLNDDALLQTASGFTSMQQVAYAPWKETPGISQYGMLAAATNNVGNENQFKHAGVGLRDEPRMLCFVCVMIPRATLNLVGMLDERYIGYGLDDDDDSLRVRRAGLKLGVYDGCFVDHSSLDSSYRGKNRAPGASGDFTPNMLRFIDKWGHDNRGHGRDTSAFKALFTSA